MARGTCTLDFDIDHYINPWIPCSFVHVFPRPISWLLGHRSEPRPPIGYPLTWFWAFTGAFLGILMVEAVFHLPALRSHGTPIIVASMGAAAILEYNTIDSPLAQPRNVVVGQLSSALIGVGVTKLFQLSSNFESLRWIAGALAVGLSSACMGFLKSVHPPAGATALLAVTTDEITTLGWFLVPLVLLGSILMLVVACVVNNIQRQYPMYWWTPARLERPNQCDIERTDSEQNDSERTDSEQEHTQSEDVIMETGLELLKHYEARIVITDGHIRTPTWISLDDEQKSMLEILRNQIHQGLKRKASVETDRTQVHHLGENKKQNIPSTF